MGEAKRAAIYTRISLDRTEGDSLKRQESACRELAEREGYEVARVYADSSKSAYSGAARPAFELMLTDARVGAFDAIIVWATDRLYRRVIDLEALIPLLDEKRIPVLGVRSGRVDLSTADGRGTARLLVTVAQMESDKKGERVSARVQQRVFQDRTATTGTRPYGWAFVPGKRCQLEPHPTEADVVRDVYKRYNSGESIQHIAKSLNAAGVASAGGGVWTQSILSRVIRNPRHGGLISYKGEIQAGLTSSAGGLVSESVWRQAKARWEKSPVHRGRPVQSWCVRLLECAECGGVLRGSSADGATGSDRRPGGKKVRYKTYACLVSKHVVWKRETLDALVEAKLLALLDELRPALEEEARAIAWESAQRDSAGGAGITAEIERLEGLLAEQEREWLAGNIATERYNRSVRLLDDLLEAERGKLAPEPHSPLQSLLDASSVREAWKEADLETKTRVAALFIDHVVVGKARKRSIEVVWQG